MLIATIRHAFQCLVFVLGLSSALNVVLLPKPALAESFAFYATTASSSANAETLLTVAADTGFQTIVGGFGLATNSQALDFDPITMNFYGVAGFGGFSGI